MTEAAVDDGTGPRVAMRVDGVSCYYGPSEAVKNVSLTIRRGEILGLVGPSGCGKTTFLRSLNRLLDLVPGARAAGDRLSEHLGAGTRAGVAH